MICFLVCLLIYLFILNEVGGKEGDSQFVIKILVEERRNTNKWTINFGGKKNQDLGHFVFQIAINTCLHWNIGCFYLLTAYDVFLIGRSYFISSDFKILVNAKESILLRTTTKIILNLRGIQKEKEIKTIVFKAIYFIRWKKSETIIMRILEVCGDWSI